MRIARLIGLLVVNPMHGGPEDGAAFERESPANREEVFQTAWNLVGAMGMQTVVTHADPQAGGYPIKEYGNGESLPIKHKKRANGADMKQHQDDDSGPVQAMAVIQIDGFFAHRYSLSAECIFTITGELGSGL
jgi:hypothetical protein